MPVRFAPSPTGDFHVGNLRTAWVSHRLARELELPWVVRFEDIDRPRVVAGARESQLADLRALGLEPDQVLLQSASEERHWGLFARAIGEGAVYPCFCSRKDVLQATAQAASAPHGPSVHYSGRCRDPETRSESDHPTLAWRFRAADPSGAGDFIVARTGRLAAGEKLPPRGSFSVAYNWACAIDDYDGGYRLLVRAWDLDPVAGPQRAVHEWLARAEAVKPVPAIFHASLVVQDDGHRLEKRTRGVRLEELRGRGIPESALLSRFEESFEPPEPDFPPGSIRGEAKRTLTLTELSL